MAISPSSSGGPSTDAAKKIRVMVVDDSAVIRGLLTRTLEKDSDITVVCSARNGQVAVDSVRSANPDIAVLDIEMPVMDGIEAIPLLLKEKPDLKILMCSTLSRKGATISMKALQLGATECLVKPTSTNEISSSDSFQQNLLKIVKSLGRKIALERGEKERETAAGPVPAVAPQDIPLRDIRKTFHGKYDILAIGSSTGGPQALFTALRDIKGIKVPVVITQHMPKTFTALLAEHIGHNCGVPAQEGAEGMVVENGHVYVAPGGFHMELVREGLKTYIHINDGPQENFCKPSVDPMMRSVVDIYGQKALGVMLTGMGNDGLESFRKLAERGGNVIAQDEQSSVVWGMPGAVAMAGLCTEVLPIAEIRQWLRKNFTE